MVEQQVVDEIIGSAIPEFNPQLLYAAFKRVRARGASGAQMRAAYYRTMGGTADMNTVAFMNAMLKRLHTNVGADVPPMCD